MKTRSNHLEDPLALQELKRAVAEKEQLVANLIEKLERLRIDLSLVKQEYEVIIGRLYLRLDEVELEILMFTKIGELMVEGFSFEEAKEAVEEGLRDEAERLEQESQRLGKEAEFLESEKIIPEEEKAELINLYRKLARMFHPDLGHGDEEMMKKINKAYKEADLEMLRSLDRSEEVTKPEELTVEALKEKPSRLEKSLDRITREYSELERSEGFVIKENIEAAKKQGGNFLGELSEKILTEIAEKENRLKDLKGLYE